MWLFSNTKVHSLIYRTCFLLGHIVQLLVFLLQLLESTLQLARDNGQLFGQDPLLVFQVPLVGLRKVSFTLGSLDILLRDIPGLFKFFILRYKGLYSLY